MLAALVVVLRSLALICGAHRAATSSDACILIHRRGAPSSHRVASPGSRNTSTGVRRSPPIDEYTFNIVKSAGLFVTIATGPLAPCLAAVSVTYWKTRRTSSTVLAASFVIRRAS